MYLQIRLLVKVLTQGFMSQRSSRSSLILAKAVYLDRNSGDYLNSEKNMWWAKHSVFYCSNSQKSSVSLCFNSSEQTIKTSWSYISNLKETILNINSTLFQKIITDYHTYLNLILIAAIRFAWVLNRQRFGELWRIWQMGLTHFQRLLNIKCSLCAIYYTWPLA